jgi:hypothetical protein
MKAMTAGLVLVFVAISTSGCMSLWSYEASKREIQRDRVLASGNERAVDLIVAGCAPDVAIRAVALEGGAGIGVDVANLAALTKHPARQTGAAVLDALLMYGSYRGVEWLRTRSESDSDRDAGSPNNQTAGRDTITIVVSGDGNTLDIGDRPVTTTTATTTTTAPEAP